MKRIRNFVKNTFKNLPKEQRDEIVNTVTQSLVEKIEDLMESGLSLEEAIDKTVVEFGTAEDYFDHEKKDGQDFFVDLTLSVDLTIPSNSDAIEDTVNYAEITDLVVEEITSNPVNLIEKLAGRIAERVLNQHLKVQQVSVTVHKPQAPVAAQLKDIAVVVTRSR